MELADDNYTYAGNLSTEFPSSIRVDLSIEFALSGNKSREYPHQIWNATRPHVYLSYCCRERWSSGLQIRMHRSFAQLAPAWIVPVGSQRGQGLILRHHERIQPRGWRTSGQRLRTSGTNRIPSWVNGRIVVTRQTRWFYSIGITDHVACHCFVSSDIMRVYLCELIFWCVWDYNKTFISSII